MWETSNIFKNIFLPVYLRVLGWLCPVLAVGGEVAGVVVVRVLDLGRVGEGDHHQVVVADGAVLLAGLDTEGLARSLKPPVGYDLSGQANLLLSCFNARLA